MQVSNEQRIVDLLCIGVDCNWSKVDRIAFCILVFWYIEKESVSSEPRCYEDDEYDIAPEFTLNRNFGLPEPGTCDRQYFLIASRLK